MSVESAKSRLNQGVGEPATGFVSANDVKLAFDDLESAWQGDLAGVGGGGGGPGVSVLGFGADPTGAADSRGAIQDAIDSVAAAGGGVVFVPAGTYRIVPSANAGYSGLYGGVQLKSSVILQGEGFATQLFGHGTWTSEAGVVGIGNATTTKPVRQAQVRDLWIKGSGAGTGHASEIVNCTGILFNTAAISEEPDAVHRITNIWLWDCHRGIVLYGTDDQAVVVDTVRGRWFRGQGVVFGREDGSGGGPDNFLSHVDISSANRAGLGAAAFEIYAGNTHLNACKAWYVKRSEAFDTAVTWHAGAGFYFAATRIMGADIEAQDCGGHGVVVRYGQVSIAGMTLDSNSYYDNVSGAAATNECSGLVINSGASGSTFTAVAAYNRSPSHQDQKHGIYIDSSVRNVSIMGTCKDNAVTAGSPVTGDQVKWSGSTHSTHLVAVGTTASSSSSTVTNGLSSSGLSGPTLVRKAGVADESLVTGTTLVDDTSLTVDFAGGALRYALEGLIVYRADAATDAKMAIKTTIVSGSGTCEGYWSAQFTDASGVPSVATRYANSSGSNLIVCEGAGQDSATSTVRTVAISGHVYAGATVTTGRATLAVAESSGTGNGVKVIVGSWLRLTPLAT